MTSKPSSAGEYDLEHPAKETGGPSCTSRRMMFVWLCFAVVIIIVLLILTIFFGIKASKTSPEVVSPSYGFCSNYYPACANNVQDFARIMNHVDGFFGPACASNNMMGRFLYFPFSGPVTVTALNNKGRMVFAIGPEMLSRILVMGDDKATNIAKELGYGDRWTCGTPQMNYTDCQYRLILWSVPCPVNRPPLIPGFWDNLEPFFRQYVYGAATPNLTSAIAEIRAAQGLLQAFTNCNPYTLNANNQWWNVSNQIAANCSQDFINNMSYFNPTSPRCNGTNATSPTWTTGTGCQAEDRFLAIPNPTAIQLRAYLMQNEGFNPLFTGYGYTSNTDYYDPLQQEYWFPNYYLSKLDNLTVLNITNGTAFGIY